jgi:hypothetical protein
VEAGICLAIEVMAGRPEVGSGKFEQDMIIHEDQVELLTNAASPLLGLPGTLPLTVR